MEVRKSEIEGLVEIWPRVFNDERGFFFESYKKPAFESAGLDMEFVQDNQSFSKKGSLRGLHFQKPPFAQGKLVRVISGRVLDVAVDLRSDSPTYGKHQSFILDGKDNNMLYVPEGFAHGFQALEDSVFFYKCTNLYDKESEAGIIFNDPDLNIEWGEIEPNISEKDAELPRFSELPKIF